MRLLIDLQSVQSASRFRGIGRYSLSLALAMARNAGDHEISLALNGAFPESIINIRRRFDGLIPNERIQVFEPPSPVAEFDSANKFRARAAEKIREHFLQQWKPDMVHVSSLFEGYEDNAVTSVGEFASGVPIAATLYDLIPLLNQQEYLINQNHRDYYMRKVQSLKKTNLLLAISEASRDEAIEALKLRQDQVVNISAATDNCFAPLVLKNDKIQQIRTRYGIQRKMVMYAPGGFDYRKNCDGLIRAYAQLSAEVRDSHQLVIVSRIDDITYQNLQKLRKQVGLGKRELILTGYVPDNDLVELYNLATLSVFPSKHEGFGLPALEAMACGAPTIGSNTTSIPEVIGWETALFDPNSVSSIANKMQQALKNDQFRDQLRKHGLEQAKKFSWDESSKRAIAAFEIYLEQNRSSSLTSSSVVTSRLKLAYISPLPPERSGISDYSAELLPELARYYDIDVIVEQRMVADPWIHANCNIRTVKWFQENAGHYHRILYQLGNSPFHSHMFDLMRQFPGVVVLHDFFLSAVLAHDDETIGARPGAWTEALYQSHGYTALAKRLTEGSASAVTRYPSNLDVLQRAIGMIVHSEHSRWLAQSWYGQPREDWALIPLLRIPASGRQRTIARRDLGLAEDSFVVCSLGFIDPSKYNHRLLEAWCASSLASDPGSFLIFVGENHGGEYGQQLLQRIHASGFQDRIRITGWTDKETFENYLAAADIGVQLRTLSRGETSAAALDCMNHGLATIVNANGSMAYLPDSAVWKLPDEFDDSELVEALEKLYQNGEQRLHMSNSAREIIHHQHHPTACAKRYAQSIEAMYLRAATDQRALAGAIIATDDTPLNKATFGLFARSIAASTQLMFNQKQLLVDVSSIAQIDLKTGIERVVRSQLQELIKDPPKGFRVEPVYLVQEAGKWHYRYARTFSCQMLGLNPAKWNDLPIDIGSGDVFYGLDFAPSHVVEAAKAGVYLKWQASGVVVAFLVYDLLPVLRPEFFPIGADAIHSAWLKTIVESSSQLISISQSVANELETWIKTNMPTHKTPIRVDPVHLGADIKASLPTKGISTDAQEVFERMGKFPSFLIVGTLEPRKGHLQVLAAFEKLWNSGEQLNLIVVGNEGWKHLPDSQRRTMSKIIAKISQHVELGKRLFWLKGISDEYLEKIYEVSTCLIAPSEAEGFGLPLIEAAQHGIPIIARDIPVFREVAQDKAFYFKGLAASDLAEAVKSWIKLNLEGNIPMSNKMQWSTWKQAAHKVATLLTGSKNEIDLVKQKTQQKAMDEHLNLIHAARVAMVSTLLPSGDCILDLGGANCPLYKMGYPHQFKKLTLIDLPPDRRHDYYKDIEVDSNCPLGPVVVRYTDMTTLEGIPDESVDFVWSGQSIEHVPLEAGERMCREAFRVLKKGGVFCLDTPNRRLTEIHTASGGGGFIHPEHYIEYYPEHLIRILKTTGFLIKNSSGICEMPQTLASGEFHYEDFMFGKQITPQVQDGYIQFHHCVKQ